MTRERPILFQGAMVRAILDGSKTQTRRVVKPPVSCRLGGRHTFYPAGRWWVGPCPTGGYWAVDVPEGPPSRWSPSGDGFPSPYGAPGDLLHVRETWCPSLISDGGDGWVNLIQYRADGHETAVPDEHADWFDARESHGYHWRPSIHMPKWASRLWLRVTDVRVERVQEITTADACAEGVPGCRDHLPNVHAVEWFHQLWESINEQRGFGWEANPWVWVVEFERTEGS